MGNTDLIHGFSNYISGATAMSNKLIGLGALLLLGSGLAFLMVSKPIKNGLVFGLLFGGLFMLISGFVYRNFNKKLEKMQTEIYKEGSS